VNNSCIGLANLLVSRAPISDKIVPCFGLPLTQSDNRADPTSILILLNDFIIFMNLDMLHLICVGRPGSVC